MVKRKTLEVSQELGRTTDHVIFNLFRMLEKLDDKIKAVKDKRHIVKHYLKLGTSLDESQLKTIMQNAKKQLDSEFNEDQVYLECIDIEFDIILDSIEGLRNAIFSQHVVLLDEVNDRIVRYLRYVKPVENQQYVRKSTVYLCKLNIIQWFRLAFYELLKEQEKAEEIRDQKYENSGLQISNDVARYYDAGMGREVKGKIERGEDLKDSKENFKEEEEDDDEF